MNQQIPDPCLLHLQRFGTQHTSLSSNAAESWTLKPPPETVSPVLPRCRRRVESDPQLLVGTDQGPRMTGPLSAVYRHHLQWCQSDCPKETFQWVRYCPRVGAGLTVGRLKVDLLFPRAQSVPKLSNTAKIVWVSEADGSLNTPFLT